jgi:hypothetical protein
MNTSNLQEPTAEEESRHNSVTPAHINGLVDADVNLQASLPDLDNVADAEDPAVQCNGAEVDIAATLTSLQPSERVRKKTSFHEHYKDVEAALARGVTHAAVRDALKRMGLSLSAATFRKLLETERNLGKSTHDGHEQSAGGAA